MTRKHGYEWSGEGDEGPLDWIIWVTCRGCILPSASNWTDSDPVGYGGLLPWLEAGCPDVVFVTPFPAFAFIHLPMPCFIHSDP